jgi:hypothetical protein
LERLRRESFLEAVGYDPSSVREMRELVEVLSSQVEMLRAELDEAHAANRENRRIMAALTQRILELDAPSEPLGGPESVAEELERQSRPAATAYAQEGWDPPCDTAEWSVPGTLLRPWLKEGVRGLSAVNETARLAWVALLAAHRTQAKVSTVRLLVPRAPEVTDEMGMEPTEERMVWWRSTCWSEVTSPL